MLSLVLAIAMLVSLLPAITVSAGNEELHSLDYVFASAALATPCADYTDIPKVSDLTLNREVSTGYWEYVTRRSMGFALYSAGAQTSMSAVSAVPGDYSVSLKITVDKAGEYVPTLNYHPMPYSGLFDTYLVDTSYTSNPGKTFFDKATLEKMIEDADTEDSGVYKTVSVDTYAASGKDTDPTVSVSGGAINLEAKDYYLVFILSTGAVESTHPKSKTYAYIHSFNLTEKGSISVNVVSADEAIKPGATTTVTGTVLNGETPVSADITYTSSDKSIATVDATTGVVTAVSAGKATITASATVGGENVSGTVEITVLPLESDPVYVFSALGANAELSSSVDLITSYINTAKSTSTGEWMHHASIGLYGSRVLYNDYLTFSASLKTPVEGERSMVLKLRVDEAGKYKPELVFDKNTVSSYVSAYLVSVAYANSQSWAMKSSPNLKAAMADSNSIKLVSAEAHSESDTSDDFFADSIELESGEYYLILNIGTGKNQSSHASRTFFNVRSLSLTQKGEASVKVTAEKEAIKIGATTTVTGTVLEGDAPVSANVTYSSANDAIATVDAQTGVVTGVSEGKVKIIASATVGGENVSGTVEIEVLATVKNPQFIFNKSAVNDGTTALFGVTSPDQINREVSSGLWYWLARPGLHSANALDANNMLFAATDGVIDAPGKNALVMAMEIDETAIYTPTVTYQTGNANGYLDMYLVPKTYAEEKGWAMTSYGGIENVVAERDSANTKVAHIFSGDSYFSSTKTEEVSGKAVSLEAGEYYFLVNITQGAEHTQASNGRTYAYIRSLELKQFEPYITVEKERVDIEVGESLTLDAKLMVSSDTSDNASFTYVSSKDSVVSINADGKLTANAVGDATVTISTIYGGKSYTKEVSVTVLAYDPGNGGVVREYFLGTRVMTAEAYAAAVEEENDGDSDRGVTAEGILYGTSFMDEPSEFDYTKTAPWMWMNFGRVSMQMGKDYLQFTCARSDYYSSVAESFPTIKIEVPNKGEYSLYMNLTRAAYGTGADIYAVNVRDVDKVDRKFVDSLKGTEIGRVDSDGAGETGYIKVASANFPSAGEYYIILNLNTENETVVGNYKKQAITIKEMKLAAMPKSFEKVAISLENVEPGEPIALRSVRNITVEMADEYGIAIDEFAPGEEPEVKIDITPGIAEIMADGRLDTTACGEATITASVTYKGETKTGTYEILVTPAGRNLLDHHNIDFETDEWIWSTPNEPTAPEGKWWQRTFIGTAPTEEDPDNRALGVKINPEYSVEDVYGVGKTPPTPSYISGGNGYRVAVKPGRFYYMSFRMKIEDLVTPEGYAVMDMSVSLYPYTTMSNASSYKIGFDRSTSLNKNAAYSEKQGEWVTVTIPVSAPFNSDLAEVYITPIFVFRPNSAGRKVPGYSATVWFDDFELREVGFADMEIEVVGDLDTGVANDVTIFAKPRTANGMYISIGDGVLPDSFTFSTSDERVIGDIRDTARTLYADGTGLYFAGMTATPGGMNGSTELNTSMTLNGITRHGSLTAVASFFKYGLLYVNASAEPVSIGEGNTTQIITTGLLTDGTDADLTDATIIYSCETPDIITVDENGVVTPVRAGTGKVLVTAVLNGVVKSTTAEISVVDTSDLESVALTGPETVGLLRDEPISLTGVMASGASANFDSMEVEWKISSEPVGGVHMIGNTAVFGDILGAVAEIYAVVKHNGRELETNKITVTVTETDLRDYMLYFGRTDKDDYRDLNVDEDGWEVIEEKSNGNHRTILKREYIHVRMSGVNQQYTVKIKVPYTGVYKLIFTGAAYGNYSAENTNIYMDDIFIGDYSFYFDGSSSICPPEDFRTMYLTAGEHELVFNPTKQIDVGSKGAYMSPAKIRFMAVSELPEISEIKMAKRDFALAPGEKESINASLVTADGFEYNWQTTYSGAADPMASISFESLDENVARVSENGEITAVATGETKIMVTVVSNNDTKTEEINVVVDGSEIDVAYITTDRRTFYVGETETLSVEARLANGKALPSGLMSVEWSSDPAGIVSFDDNKMTANATGNTTVTGSVTYYGGTIPVTADITVLPDTLGEVEILGDKFVMSPGDADVELSVKGKTYAGRDADITGATVSWESDNEAVATVSENGVLSPIGVGTAEITATVELGDKTVYGNVSVSVREGKTERTYYTEEKVAAARENIQKYSWAKSKKDTAVATAERYLSLSMEDIWKIVPADTIPRSIEVGMKNDPERYFCRYCGINFEDVGAGSYSWVTNAIAKPWKVQCSHCKRLFPSNDFAKLYELGLDEHGEYNIELAHERNEALVEETGGKVDYLRNTLYPELEGFKGKFTGKETKEGWGVDDGLGYDTGRKYSNGVREVHTYIAVYMHWGVWYGTAANHSGVVQRATNALAEAYLYTGDAKYGRLGAVLIDRLADVYPGYDVSGWISKGYNNGATNYGKTMNYVWDTTTAKEFARAYDAFFPMYDDPEVVKFLNKQAVKYKLDNKKETPEAIRDNIEDGVLREIYEGVKTLEIHGNFGMHQAALATAAVVLDTQPETNDMIDFVFRTAGPDVGRQFSGGDVGIHLVNNVSRDGQGTESAPGYNRIWLTQLVDLANDLAGYDGYDGEGVWENPKYITMFRSYNPLTMVHRGLPPIGDSGGSGIFNALPDNVDALLSALQNTTDPETGHRESAKEIAQIIYRIHGGEKGDLSALHYNIWTKDPNSVQKVIYDFIDEYGPYPYDKSSILTGYGFAALRAGSLHKDSSVEAIRDKTHDFSIYFGGATSHCHFDTLNLSLNAYGISMSSDLGYPEATGHDPNRAQWCNATISHNAVVVNEENQLKSVEPAKPLHFDAKDTRVKVMDIDASVVYPETDEYRRTVVMVDYDDEISYGVDFFKVLGGDDHLYSFHASTEHYPETELDMCVQPMGTYASIDVPYGEDPYTYEGDNTAKLKYPLGYTWLYDVKRADNPGVSQFYVDYEMMDIQRSSRNPASSMGIRMRLTMVNDFEIDEVTVAKGKPMRTAANLKYIDHLQYLLVRRKGRDLNTLFTSVIEPYNKERYISNISAVDIAVKEGTPGVTDKAAAVKIELVDGRIDYVVYAQNENVTYTITDGDMSFDFRGFVGVWTVNGDGENVYTYANDAELIGDVENLDAALCGTVTDFTRELSLDNFIEVAFDTVVEDEELLVDRIINVEFEGAGNAAYWIRGAELAPDGRSAKLSIGNVTTIDSYIDNYDRDAGYNYDIAVGKSFEIPLSYEDNKNPIFDELADNLSTSAGSLITIKVNAKAQDESAVTYKERTLPRGASFDAETGTVSWKPTSSQIGESLFAVDATDEMGRTSTLYFTVSVYGSTGAGGSGSSGTTGSMGNTGTTTPTIPATPGADKKDETTTPSTPSTPTTPDVESDSNVRFIDLGNHAWAADAINALAEEGIIKGTSENTFSPAANITRADFAILLVRAFELASESEENFADVSSSDYFAKELAVARNTGLVNGIGENKFAPRNNITRQDMMVIVYRALVAMEKIATAENTPSASDFDAVADYAKEAVSALIDAKLVNGKNGLIAPTDFTTRAEVAVLIKRILDFIK